jgi:pyruvate dehydrogenase E2 component (dihydrolipoamide acetyltransferase)
MREVNMTAVEAARAQGGVAAATVTSYVVAACGRALAAHPAVNVAFTVDGLVERDKVNVGIAVGLEDGLAVPVVQDVNLLRVGEIGELSRELAGRAREGRMRGGDLAERSMVVSSLGMAGVTAFLAIIDQPDAMILSIGATSERWVRADAGSDAGKWQTVATLGLAVDHRALDGLQAARFLETIAAELEAAETLI